MVLIIVVFLVLAWRSVILAVAFTTLTAPLVLFLVAIIMTMAFTAISASLVLRRVLLPSVVCYATRLVFLNLFLRDTVDLVAVFLFVFVFKFIYVM